MENNTIDRFKTYVKMHPITGIILIINFVLFLILFVVNRFNLFSFSIPSLIAWGAIYPEYIFETNQYFRLVSSMFLHGNGLHFFMNSLVLFYLGGHLEQILGPKKYLILYGFSGIGASLAVLFLGDPRTVTIGASGAIFGVVGGLFLFTYLMPKWFTLQSIKSIRQLTLINLVLTFAVPNISIPGHIGGLILGIAIAYFIKPDFPYVFRHKIQFYQASEKKDQDNDPFLS